MAERRQFLGHGSDGSHQIQDPPGILADHRADPIHVCGKMRALLPGGNHRSLVLPHALDLQQALLVHGSKLSQGRTGGQKMQKPKVVDTAGPIDQTGSHRLEIGLHAVLDSDLFQHQWAPSPTESLEGLVDRVARSHFGDDSSLFLQVGSPPHFHDLAGIDRIGLGRAGKKLLAAGQFQMVAVEQGIPFLANPWIERPSLPMEPFPPDHDRKFEGGFGVLELRKEGAKTAGGMRNTELFDDVSVGSSDGHPVLTAAHVDTDQKPVSHDGVLPYLVDLRVDRPPSRLSTEPQSPGPAPSQQTSRDDQREQGRHFRVEPIQSPGSRTPRATPLHKKNIMFDAGVSRYPLKNG